MRGLFAAVKLYGWLPMGVLRLGAALAPEYVPLCKPAFEQIWVNQMMTIVLNDPVCLDVLHIPELTVPCSPSTRLEFKLCRRCV